MSDVIRKNEAFMKMENKKKIVFTIMLSIATSTYAAFLNTVMKQGFLTDHFFSNWFRLAPRIFLFIFPFVLIMGPTIRTLVERMFRNGTKYNAKSK